MDRLRCVELKVVEVYGPPCATRVRVHHAHTNFPPRSRREIDDHPRHRLG